MGSLFSGTYGIVRGWVRVNYGRIIKGTTEPLMTILSPCDQDQDLLLAQVALDHLIVLFGLLDYNSLKVKMRF